MVRRVKPSQVYLIVAVLAVVVIAFLMFSGGRTGRFFSATQPIYAQTLSATQSGEEIAYGVEGVIQKLRNIQQQACCPVAAMPAMAITSANAVVNQQGAPDCSGPSVTWTYTTTQPTPCRVDYRTQGSAATNSHSNYCSRDRTCVLTKCGLQAGKTYEYKAFARTYPQCVAQAGNAETEWKTFQT